MQDRQLYAEILGIQAPWFVDRVELSLTEGEVHVHLDHDDVLSWPHAECGEACRPYDHQPEQQRPHLDTCQYRTISHARPPCGECRRHWVRGVDERAFRKGQKYFARVSDLERSRVLYVAEERTQASLDGSWETLAEEQVASMEAVAMDMWNLLSPRCGNTLRVPMARLCSTSFTSPSIREKPWIECGVARTRRRGRRAMTV